MDNINRFQCGTIQFEMFERNFNFVILKEKNANGDLPLSGSKADGSEQDSANKVIPAVPIEAMEKKRLLLKGYMEESIMETKDIPLKVSRAAPSSSASLQAVSAVSNSHNQQHSL